MSQDTKYKPSPKKTPPPLPIAPKVRIVEDGMSATAMVILSLSIPLLIMLVAGILEVIGG